MSKVLRAWTVVLHISLAFINRAKLLRSGTWLLWNQAGARGRGIRRNGGSMWLRLNNRDKPKEQGNQNRNTHEESYPGR